MILKLYKKYLKKLLLLPLLLLKQFLVAIEVSLRNYEYCLLYHTKRYEIKEVQNMLLHRLQMKQNNTTLDLRSEINLAIKLMEIM